MLSTIVFLPLAGALLVLLAGGRGDRPDREPLVRTLALGVSLVTFAATLLLWWRSRAQRAASRSADAAAPSGRRTRPLRKLLRDLDSACSAGDADAARRALLEFADLKYGPAAPRSLGALAAVLPDAVGREVLALEAQIYGAPTGAWQGDGLQALLPELERLTGLDEQAKNEPLLPLYR